MAVPPTKNAVICSIKSVLINIFMLNGQKATAAPVAAIIIPPGIFLKNDIGGQSVTKQYERAATMLPIISLDTGAFILAILLVM